MQGSQPSRMFRGIRRTPQASQTSVPVTFTAAQTAGDLNVVAVGWNDSTATVTKVADTSGNILHTGRGAPPSQSGVATAVHILRQEHPVAAAMGANIVTVTFCYRSGSSRHSASWSTAAPTPSHPGGRHGRRQRQ